MGKPSGGKTSVILNEREREWKEGGEKGRKERRKERWREGGRKGGRRKVGWNHLRLQCISQQSLKRPLNVLELWSPFKGVSFLSVGRPPHSVTGQRQLVKRVGLVQRGCWAVAGDVCKNWRSGAAPPCLPQSLRASWKGEQEGQMLWPWGLYPLPRHSDHLDGHSISFRVWKAVGNDGSERWSIRTLICRLSKKSPKQPERWEVVLSGSMCASGLVM